MSSCLTIWRTPGVGLPAGTLELSQGALQGLLDARVIGFTSVSKAPYRGKGWLYLINRTHRPLRVFILYVVKFRDTQKQSTQDVAVFVTRVETAAAPQRVFWSSRVRVVRVASVAGT